MSENENSLVTQIIPFLIIYFGLRGAIIFPNSPAIITEVKIFDIISFIILGIFLGILVILGYNKKLITLLACSWVLGFSVFNLVVKIIYPYGILLLSNHFYRLILLISLITLSLRGNRKDKTKKRTNMESVTYLVSSGGQIIPNIM